MSISLIKESIFFLFLILIAISPQDLIYLLADFLYMAFGFVSSM